MHSFSLNISYVELKKQCPLLGLRCLKKAFGFLWTMTCAVACRWTISPFHCRRFSRSVKSLYGSLVHAPTCPVFHPANSKPLSVLSNWDKGCLSAMVYRISATSTERRFWPTQITRHDSDTSHGAGAVEAVPVYSGLGVWDAGTYPACCRVDKCVCDYPASPPAWAWREPGDSPSGYGIQWSTWYAGLAYCCLPPHIRPDWLLVKPWKVAKLFGQRKK